MRAPALSSPSITEKRGKARPCRAQSGEDTLGCECASLAWESWPGDPVRGKLKDALELPSKFQRIVG